MRIQWFLVAAVFGAALVPSRAAAQHEAHQAKTQPTPEMAQCVQVQPMVQNIITAASARLESARQSNSPADMRAAIENFETALRDIRTQLAPCATAAAAPHEGHATPSAPSAPPTGAAPVKPPAAADPHAGHQMAPSAPAVKPPGKPAESAPAHEHAGHATELKPGQQRDPVNGLIVDPATAPKTTYQGQTYHFSSEESRKEFLANPAKFARKPKK